MREEIFVFFGKVGSSIRCTALGPLNPHPRSLTDVFASVDRKRLLVRTCYSKERKSAVSEVNRSILGTYLVLLDSANLLSRQDISTG